MKTQISKIMFKYIYLVLIVLVLGLFTSNYYYKTQVNKLQQNEIILNNNNKAYSLELENIEDSLKNIRGVYLLKLDQINHSSDSIILENNKLRKKLKIKDSELIEFQTFVSNMKLDTTINITNIINDSCDFNISIEYNDQTIFHVENKKIDHNYILKHSADISSSYTSFIVDKKEWKEPNFFKRLFLFKWGKNSWYEGLLLSDNDKIKIKDFKIVKVDK